MTEQKPYFQRSTSAAPLAVFRILFGLIMVVSMVRFWALGWIEKLYIEPKFFFSYYGFEWVKPLGEWTYLLFAVCGLSALMVAIGWKYRLAIITFFLSFTYIELMDKTTYLNHYYFVSLVAFLMIFLPAGKYFSVDASTSGTSFKSIPKWTIEVLKLLIALVYFYAGLAKLNSEWLLHAMPLKIWLPSTDVPFLSQLFQYEWMIYGFAWAGAIYDLSIPFLLWNKKTRSWAFGLVVIFHVLTSLLFPIGMFPYIMILGALIFFDSKFHERIINFLQSIFGGKELQEKTLAYSRSWQKISASVIVALLVVQSLLPFRHLLYPGELFWNEEGFRFSWRVMLMEKAGYAEFKIKTNEGEFLADNSEFLTPFQEKQMATQPDFILEYAHMLGKHFEGLGHTNVQVFANSYVALNGRRSRQFVDPNENLLNHQASLAHKPWILPFNDEIKGL